MADDETLEALARRAGTVLAERGWRMTVAESCTGGGVAKAVTDVAGSSAWFERGFVTYSDAAKQEMLGVSAATIAAHGAVSAAVVEAMASGALERSGADVAVAVSGVAGPGGGSGDKPVGTVWFAWARRGQAPAVRCHRLGGDRPGVRAAAVRIALEGVIEAAGERVRG